ncbi:hypothetical protein [Amycolatopsis saalfeldensis]|uniref:Uncharacterized protein n=1 Tax=Amycolatopsis saalfeldensis TaxID=394193 RepID=A0A1H8Y887_9PSEU|nr:hypothetical protein [Amycolatopsis saalfeldensis]SEP48365.1 hypothetical protein SAMN04489732_11213 [Amycolatopsis saalfeldensis]
MSSATVRAAEGIALSVICPTRNLTELADQDPPTVHYLAAHRILTDVPYVDFYRDQGNRGAHLIVDNGAFELGSPLSSAALLHAARMVGAHEVVLPDYLHDGTSTWAASSAAARELMDNEYGIGLCGVVQGADDLDWYRCLERMTECAFLDSIALPAPKRSDSSGPAFNRIAATAYMAERGLVDPNICYRLLGLSDSGDIELARQRRHTWIKSVDCATPVVMAALNIAILPGEGYRKPELSVEHIDSLNSSMLALARSNVTVLREAAGCDIRFPHAVTT